MEKNDKGIKACPFCGSIDITFDKETKCGGFGEYYENYYIRCNKCGCKKTFSQGYLGTKVYTEEECIREWNTRVY